MNERIRFRNDAKLGIKAYQNLAGSLAAFERFVGLMPTNDQILLSSVFCFAVVKYAKPFVETVTAAGKTRYPVRPLKAVEGFDDAVHSHLLELRNTLIAHDDMESIEPRILSLSLSSNGFSIPVSVGISNKCLAYPIDIASALRLKAHVEACVKGALSKLNSDLEEMRAAHLKEPQQTHEEAPYTHDYGQTQVAEGGSHVEPPDFMGDNWLNSSVPSFGHIHNGLFYEEVRIRKDFYGPERHKLPDGTEIEIRPPGKSAV